jgi:HK97 family phage portal protein
MVQACVSAYAQTVAMCPGSHWLINARGGRDRQTASALNRILRKPNDYQSTSDFLLNLVSRLYRTGNAFALAIRNDRFEIKELHLMLGPCSAQESVTGEIFYNLSGNSIIERRIDGPLLVPARDVLHVRLETPRHPLIGEAPIEAAAMDVMASGAISQQQIAFYMNRARPAFVLSTDQVLTKEQGVELRQRWDEQAAGFASGGTVIASAGLKPIPLHASAQESQLADLLKMTDQHIAEVYRVPLQILGIGGTPFASTEALMQSWRASGLGFCLNHIETAFDALFGLKGMPDEYTEFETDILLRSSYKERMEGYSVGIKGGVLKINDARLKEDLERVPGGDDIRIQQQDVPLDWHDKQAPENTAPPAPREDPDEEANDNAEQLRRSFRASHARNYAV